MNPSCSSPHACCVKWCSHCGGDAFIQGNVMRLCLMSWEVKTGNFCWCFCGKYSEILSGPHRHPLCAGNTRPSGFLSSKSRHWQKLSSFLVMRTSKCGYCNCQTPKRCVSSCLPRNPCKSVALVIQAVRYRFEVVSECSCDPANGFFRRKLPPKVYISADSSPSFMIP